MSMPLSMTMQAITQIKSLAPALDEYTEWYGHVKRHIFYPTQFDDTAFIEEVVHLLSWVEELERDGPSKFGVLEDLKVMHKQLNILSQDCINVSKASNGALDYERFLQLDQLFTNFIIQLHRLEIDCLQEFSGYDKATGLRNQSSMYGDVEIELHRRARRGDSFCLALARLDHYNLYENQMVANDFDALMLRIAGIIKKCLRSFDDAYRLDNGDFVMSLKQTKNIGGSSVTARLREALKEENIAVKLNDTEVVVTMSYCLAEPIPNDSIDDLLHNMRQDLNTYDEGGDTALEYIEKSPLARFLDTGE